MNLKSIAFFTISLLGTAAFSQDSANEPIVSQPVKLSYLDSIKATFVHDAMASCVDSLWLQEITSLELYDNISEEIQHFNFDQKVDYDLPTDVLKERLKRLDAKSPFNIEYNPGLENLIKSFLKNRKKSFERLMAISEYYFPMFEEALARQNVPLEIKYLAIVESALNPKAVSRVGATGLWQFMYQTGKQYNLTIDSYVDERSDPLKSSEAAAQYMSNMYKIFGDWDLVLASYNSGPGNVAKAIRRSGGRQNYWNIRKYLPQETQGYVPAFLATMYIYEYHKEHGIKPERALVKHFETDTVMVRRELSFKQLSDLLDIPVAQLQMLNPSYKRNAIPAYFDKKHFLRLPKEKVALFTSNEDKIYAYADYEWNQREKPFSRIASSGSRDNSGNSTGTAWASRTKYHKVKRGDNLSMIANRYNVSVADIKKWNHLKGNQLMAGKSLKIVTSERVAVKEKPKKPDTVAVEKTESIAAVKDTKKTESHHEENHEGFYVVQAGDNLTGIARKFDVTVAQIKEWNNFEDNNLLAGTKIIVTKAAPEKEDVADNTEIVTTEHIVKKGEFLGFIARKYNVTIDDLKEWNNLSDVNVKIGQKLIVGKSTVAEAKTAVAENAAKKDKASQGNQRDEHYLVKKGDSLFSIARKYPGITVSDIKRWNGIKNENIKPGMKLKISG